MQKISYVGDGIINEFAFHFAFFQPADIRIAINNEIMDATYYDINPNDARQGGTVTFASPPADGTIIDIFRKIHLERFIDYQPTSKLDVESLNDDFNFMLEAFRDMSGVDLDIASWKNVHDNVLTKVSYAVKLIEDRFSGATLGLYNNLLSVLASAMPRLINDYGRVTDTASANGDDYGYIATSSAQ